jgi:hypothetical protein
MAQVNNKPTSRLMNPIQITGTANAGVSPMKADMGS